MKILVVADPVDGLKPASDTTLALVREALRRRHRVDWATASDVVLEGGSPAVHARPVLDCLANATARVGEPTLRKVSAYRSVWIRKDPPFDAEYVALCWLLALAQGKVHFFNDPAVLLRYHEKLLPFEAHAAGFLKAKDLVPTYIGSAAAGDSLFSSKGEQTLVRKPFLGFGGGGILRYPAGRPPTSAPDSGRVMVQPYLPEIQKAGDRRVFYLQGKYVGDFVRLPTSGGFVSNLAQGGRATVAPLSPAQKAVVERLGKFLKKQGIAFAGADLIGTRISEVNITSPTGVPTLLALKGIDFSKKALDYVERSAE